MPPTDVVLMMVILFKDYTKITEKCCELAAKSDVLSLKIFSNFKSWDAYPFRLVLKILTTIMVLKKL